MVFNQLAFKLVLCLFSADLRLEIADQVIAFEKVLFEVAFNHARESLWVFFALIKCILHESSQLLVVVLGIFHICRPLLVVVASHSLMEEARLYHGLSLSLLHVLFLQVSVLLLHTVLAELRAHIGNTYINVRV